MYPGRADYHGHGSDRRRSSRAVGDRPWGLGLHFAAARRRNSETYSANLSCRYGLPASDAGNIGTVQRNRRIWCPDAREASGLCTRRGFGMVGRAARPQPALFCTYADLATPAASAPLSYTILPAYVGYQTDLISSSELESRIIDRKLHRASVTEGRSVLPPAKRGTGYGYHSGHACLFARMSEMGGGDEQPKRSSAYASRSSPVDGSCFRNRSRSQRRWGSRGRLASEAGLSAADQVRG
jgi:hypothetical protein